jgi:hypothetical protein
VLGQHHRTSSHAQSHVQNLIPQIIECTQVTYVLQVTTPAVHGGCQIFLVVVVLKLSTCCRDVADEGDEMAGPCRHNSAGAA